MTFSGRSLFVRWLSALTILSFALVTLQAHAAAAVSNSCHDVFQAKSSQSQTKSTLKVAAVQYPLAEGLKPHAFLAKVSSYIKEAKAQGSELVVFPELVSTELVDWYSKQATDVEQLRQIATEFTPQYIEWLKQQAQTNGIAILGGSTPRLRGNDVVNTAVLALADGRVMLQDKLFLTPDEKQWGWVSGDTLNVFDTPWGRTVITICFDCEFPVVSNMLAAERPDVILVPSWTSTHSGLNRVDYTARARAVEHYAYVVKTGTVADPTATLPHFGQASIHTPQDKGFPVQPNEGKLNEAAIVYGTLDLQLLREKKASSGYHPSNEQNLRLTPIKIERK
jgi:predicted amidohydrolase